jgi:hypothetical protein
MAKTIEAIIKDADALIKQEKYAEAWKLLLPHKEDENARKRLKWLKSKQEQLKLEKESAAPPAKVVSQNWFMRLGWRMKLGVGLLLLCSGCLVFSMFGQWVGFIPDSTERAVTEIARANETAAILTANAPTTTDTPTNDPSATASMTTSPSPTETASPSETSSSTASSTFTAIPSETNLPTSTESAINMRSGASNSLSNSTPVPAPSATITDTPAPRPSNTAVLPTATYALYDPDTICQGEVEPLLLGILENAEGVDYVETICVQIWQNGYTTMLVELIVYPSFNTLELPELLHNTAVDALNNPDLDTLINVSDGINAIAYSHNEFSEEWSIVDYGPMIVPQTPRPR